MYVFVCPNGHYSYSAAKEQFEPACPECGEPTHLVGDESHEESIMWFPGFYKGREGVYAQEAWRIPQEELVGLVQKRAQEDGEWSIANGHVGGEEDMMRKMMEWVSRPKTIIQCLEANLDKGPTVDWICRELAEASQRIAEGSRG